MTDAPALDLPVDKALLLQKEPLEPKQSAIALASSRPLSVLGLFMALVLVVSVTMVWQNIRNVHEINRQKISLALERVIASIQEQILIVEMTANSLKPVIQTRDGEAGFCESVCLRTSLESAISAFEQRPGLSHLGLIIPANGMFGNLERLQDGDIVLWLAAPKDTGVEGMQSLLWTDRGFMPYLAANPETGRDSKGEENLRRLSVQETAWQGDKTGTWQLRPSSWMMHQKAQEWSIGYSKALYDDNGNLVAVFDANFALSSIIPHMLDLQQAYNGDLTIIEKGTIPRMIRTVSSSPLAVTDDFIQFLDLPDNNFADMVYLEGERHWVEAQKLKLQGDTDWIVIISSHFPWLNVLTGEYTTYILATVLILFAGSGIVLVYMIYRFSHIQNQKIDSNLHHLATHDDITGLLNRVAIQALIGQAITQARGQDYLIALLYLDINRFKAINDGYGYLFGNQVLQAIGERLKQSVRPQDRVSHFSGDRFIILLDQVPSKDEVRLLTRQIMEALKKPLFVQSRILHLAASIGISLYPDHGDTINALINHADAAVLESKKAGYDSYQFFTPEIGKKAQEDIDLEIALQTSLSSNQFHLVYQPKVSLQDNKISGCEVLLRWTHPELGNISPVRFIPIAEKMGLITDIGDWVLETACKQAKFWLEQGLEPACVAVNLSMRQFLRRDVVKWVAETLQQTGLPARYLELELTESMLPQDMDRAIAILDQLAILGIRLSLDDFGTGYSNLSYLKNFRIHTLKIDQAFVRNALNSHQDAAIIRTIVDLAHNLGYKTLAEGVETVEQLRFVQEQNCDEVQGYYFSRPVGPETYAIMLRDGIKLMDKESKRALTSK